MEKETTRIITYVIIFVIIAVVNIAFRKKRNLISKPKVSEEPDEVKEQPIIDVKSLELPDNLNKAKVTSKMSPVQMTPNMNQVQIKSNNLTKVKVSEYINETKREVKSNGIIFSNEELKKAIIYSEILKPLEL